MRILDSGKNLAEENMSLDFKLLEELKPTDEPILHLYEWEKPSLTYGYFIKLDKYVNVKKLKEKNIEAARRPTGGGIVFHLWDLAFSFLMPAKHQYFFEKPVENYQFVNGLVKKTLWNFCQKFPSFLQKKDCCQSFDAAYLTPEELGPLAFCMARPSKYDLIWQGKKAAGAAQRKKRNGYLHQGTIALAYPDEKLLFDLLLDQSLAESILANSFFLTEKINSLEEMRKALKKLLICQFEETFASLKKRFCKEPLSAMIGN